MLDTAEYADLFSKVGYQPDFPECLRKSWFAGRRARRDNGRRIGRILATIRLTVGFTGHGTVRS